MNRREKEIKQIKRIENRQCSLERKKEKREERD